MEILENYSQSDAEIGGWICSLPGCKPSVQPQAEFDPVPMALFPYLGGTGDSHENHHQSLQTWFLEEISTLVDILPTILIWHSAY